MLADTNLITVMQGVTTYRRTIEQSSVGAAKILYKDFDHAAAVVDSFNHRVFGADRCMFGSNFPVDSLYSDYKTLFRAYQDIIPETMQTTVFSRTAGNFYAL